MSSESEPVSKKSFPGLLVDTSDVQHQNNGGPSNPPPAFEEASQDFVVEFSQPETFATQGGEQPPPAFTPYEAEYSRKSHVIVSHDPHLNKDGEALYRFLLSQAATPPTITLHCRGTHSELHTRLVSESPREHGSRGYRTENHVETVTDFDFSINISQHIVEGPVHWSVPDCEPAYRGQMVREIEERRVRRKATKDEIRKVRLSRKERYAVGLPPWLGSSRSYSSYDAFHHGDDQHVLKSSRTLREWADEYCSSPKYLKEFAYEKVVYGWNLDSLEAAVRSAITSVHYIGSVDVQFEVSDSKIVVQPDNRLSRALSNPWLKFLSIILLVYPLIWLFKRFHRLGGGRWEVCGGAYALKCVEPLTATVAESDLGSLSSAPNARLISTERGAFRLMGLREGEWFRQWEGTIRMAVVNRYRESEPMTLPRMQIEPPVFLDGYMDAA